MVQIVDFDSHKIGKDDALLPIGRSLTTLLIIWSNTTIDSEPHQIWSSNATSTHRYFPLWYDKQMMAVKFFLPQRPEELLAPTDNTSDCHVWPVYVDVQSVGGRIETEPKLDSWK